MSQNRTSKIILFGLTAFVAFVLIQSLFFKFSNSPETQYIFGTLNEWALSLGAPALFAPNGIFSQYVVGTFELIASVILIIGFFARMPLVHAFGALMSMGVISGAIFFHLFTPLGVQVLNTDGTKDGGELFMLACGVWISSLIILFLHRQTVTDKLQVLRR